MDNKNWIDSIIQPIGAEKQTTRRVKSFDVALLVNFGIALNVEGKMNIPLEAIGAPLRLATAKDGSVKFSASGKPSVKVAKEIVAFGTMIHTNIVKGIMADTARVFAEQEEAVKLTIQKAGKAAEPILRADAAALEATYAARAKAEAEAEAVAKAEAEAAEEKITARVRRAPRASKQTPPVEPVSEPVQEPDKELVGATA
jgi:hypothetical protein